MRGISGKLVILFLVLDADYMSVFELFIYLYFFVFYNI